MDITLPTIPAGILTLLSMVAPYAIALINRPAWSATVKKLVAIVVAILLAVIVTVFYYVYTGDAVPEWPALVLLAIVVVQASYALVTREAGAKTVESKTTKTE